MIAQEASLLCSKCHEDKPVEDFAPRPGRRGRRSHCRACSAKTAAAHLARCEARGACGSCGVEREPGTGSKLYCDSCLRKRNATSRSHQRARVAAGVCRNCGQLPIDSPGHRCRGCYWRQMSGQHLGSPNLGHLLRAKYEAQRGRCHYTGVLLRIEPGPTTWDSLSVDHVTPRSKGGAETIDNVVLCTHSVNMAKGTMDVRSLLAMARALLRTAGELPANDTGIDLLSVVQSGHWLGADGPVPVRDNVAA